MTTPTNTPLPKRSNSLCNIVASATHVLQLLAYAMPPEVEPGVKIAAHLLSLAVSVARGVADRRRDGHAAQQQ